MQSDERREKVERMLAEEAARCVEQLIGPNARQAARRLEELMPVLQAADAVCAETARPPMADYQPGSDEVRMADLDPDEDEIHAIIRHLQHCWSDLVPVGRVDRLEDRRWSVTMQDWLDDCQACGAVATDLLVSPDGAVNCRVVLNHVADGQPRVMTLLFRGNDPWRYPVVEDVPLDICMDVRADDDDFSDDDPTGWISAWPLL